MQKAKIPQIKIPLPQVTAIRRSRNVSQKLPMLLPRPLAPGT